MSNRISSGFEKLNRCVQKWIWNKGWTELRDIQEESITPILTAGQDVIIASATASGKTEAAYLPVCSYLADNADGGIKVLYISPLKALINDQYYRLEELCEYCNIPVHKWHGDVSSGKKKKLLDKPSGMLLITPESLEARFVIDGYKIKELFGKLCYIVIDELHAFLENERGKQLQSLLCRVETVIKRKVPRIGLSATIGDMSVAAEFLRMGEGNSVKIIRSQAGERELKLQIRGYKIKEPDLAEPDKASMEQIGEHIFNVLRGSDNLVFANSRAVVEVYSDLLTRMSGKYNFPNEFFPHHGSLSKQIRHEVETRLKSHLPTNAICTSTLEMGIDIGSVKSIAQIGCPFSISSLRQRLGRSGRKEGDPSVLRIYIEEKEVTEKSHPGDMLRQSLFQTTAMTELLLRKWLEPPDGNILHLSTLVQQLLSLIAQYGGIKAENAWKVLCQWGPFNRVEKKDFALFLRNLGNCELIMQTHAGDLVLGVVGERIVNHYNFYTAFVTYEEYRLIANGKTLGTIPIVNPLFKGRYLIFAGKRWEVVEVDEEQKVVLLVSSEGGQPPNYSSPPSFVHDEIRKEMFRLYRSNYIPPYLDEEAVKLFLEGRDNFTRLQLADNRIIPYGELTLIFPWLGDKVLNSLGILFSLCDIKSSHIGFLLEVQNKTCEEINAILSEISKIENVGPMKLAELVENKEREKYDRYLPDKLLCAEYASRFIDVEGALNCAASLVNIYRDTNAN